MKHQQAFFTRGVAVFSIDSSRKNASSITNERPLLLLFGAASGDVNRNWAVGGEAEMKLRDSLEALPLTALQHR